MLAQLDNGLASIFQISGSKLLKMLPTLHTKVWPIFDECGDHVVMYIPKQQSPGKYTSHDSMLLPTGTRQQGGFCPPGDIWQRLKTFFFGTKLGGWIGATGIKGADVRGDEHPTMNAQVSLPTPHRG